MTVVGYISDTEEIIKESLSNSQHDGPAAFKLSERSPLPSTLSASNLPGGLTQVINIRQIGRINCHQGNSDEESVPESISDTENWFDWNGDMDNPNASVDDWETDIESDIDLDIAIDAAERPNHQDVSSAPNVAGLVWPTRCSMEQAENGSMMVTAMEKRSNNGTKNSRTEWVNMLSPGSICCLTENYT